MRSLLPFRRLCVTAIAAAIAAAQTGAPAVNVARMRSDLEYLCSKELGGRLSLSPGAELAAEYIGREFEKAGLAPAVPGGGFLQKFTLVAPVGTSHASMAMTREGSRSDFRADIDFRTRYWRTADIKAPVVFAGYGITAPEYGYDDYAGVDVKGRAVLVFDHEPGETDPHSVFNGTGHSRWALLTVKREIARRHGAAALILVSEPLRKHAGAFDPLPGDDGKPSLRAMAPRQALDEETIPIILVSDRTAAELLRATGRSPSDLQRAIDEGAHPASMAVARTEIEFSMAAAEVRRGESANAAGVLEGADPELRGETVLISAHYDHLGTQNGSVFPGANDNASGTVAVMELARLFAKGRRPRRSLLFVVFGSEEEALLGSFYYVAHPLRSLGTTRAVLNLDMVARDEAHIPESRGVVEISNDTRNEINLVGSFYSPELETAIRKADSAIGLEISTKFDRDHDLNALFRCDHFPFLLHDVPAVWIFGGWHPGYHEPSDTIDRLDFPKLEKVVRLAYGSAGLLGDTARPPRFQSALTRVKN